MRCHPARKLFSLPKEDIMELAGLGAALMPSSMTLTPTSASVWVRTAHDICQITHDALMQTLSTLSSLMNCFCNPSIHKP